MNTCIIKREQPRVSAYNLALRAGVLINSVSCWYMHVCFLVAFCMVHQLMSELHSRAR